MSSKVVPPLGRERERERQGGKILRRYREMTAGSLNHSAKVVVGERGGDRRSVHGFSFLPFPLGLAYSQKFSQHYYYFSIT